MNEGAIQSMIRLVLVALVICARAPLVILCIVELRLSGNKILIISGKQHIFNVYM